MASATDQCLHNRAKNDQKGMRNEGQIHPVRNDSTFRIVGLLKACAKQKALEKASKIHAYAREHKLLEKNAYVGNALVTMYMRCGALAKAQQVFNELRFRDSVAWTALITGYVQHGQAEEALECFDIMQGEGHLPDAVTLTCVLKACGNIRAEAKGEEIHNKIVSLGMLDSDILLGCALVGMYAKCGTLRKARKVLHEVPVRNAATWNALIAGYAQQGYGDEALKCFKLMQSEGLSPDEATFTCALKACGSIGATAKGEEIHDKIVSLGMLEKDVVLGNSLIDMYTRCGALAKAHQVLNELPARNVVTWNALLAGYAKQGEDRELLKLFDSMLLEGHSPDAITFTCAMKACGSIGAIDKGKEIHHRIVSLGMLEKDTVLCNALIDMYVRCGALAKAREVLNELPARDVVTWNILMIGYVQQGQGKEALTCFDSMQHEGHFPNVVTFTCTLKACGIIGAAPKGEQVHHMIANLGMLEKDIALGNSVVDMYARCGALSKAQQVLEELPVRDVSTWNALIVGYTQQGQNEEALACFESMQCEGHSPNAVTFTCALKACGSIEAVAKGEQIHDKIGRLLMVEKDTMLGNTLVDMYARCGALAKAQRSFDSLPNRDVVTWSVLIAGYAQLGYGEEALKCLDNMRSKGHFPTVAIFTSALKACGIIEAFARGERLHDEIVSSGMLGKDIVLGSTLVDMYARFGALVKAYLVLNELPMRDAVTWNALLSGYTQQRRGEEALACFHTMLCEGHSPNAVTFTCALKACGITGAIAKGEQIHDKIVSLAMLEKDSMLGNALVDMYAKCAALAKAAEVLKVLPVQSVVSWNTLIGGYAQLGQSEEALNCFNRMQAKGIRPNSTTLVCVLIACSHSHLSDQAEKYMAMMSEIHDIAPELDHYCCLVDLFGRAGNFRNALAVIEKLPSVEDLPAWLALLGTCHKWGDVKIGQFAFEHVLDSDKSDAASYVCMANIYEAVDMHEDADKIEQEWQINHGI